MPVPDATLGNNVKNLNRSYTFKICFILEEERTEKEDLTPNLKPNKIKKTIESLLIVKKNIES